MLIKLLKKLLNIIQMKYLLLMATSFISIITDKLIADCSKFETVYITETEKKRKGV